MLGNAFYDLGNGWSEKNYTQWIDINPQYAATYNIRCWYYLKKFIVKKRVKSYWH